MFVIVNAQTLNKSMDTNWVDEAVRAQRDSPDAIALIDRARRRVSALADELGGRAVALRASALAPPSDGTTSARAAAVQQARRRAMRWTALEERDREDRERAAAARHEERERLERLEAALLSSAQQPRVLSLAGEVMPSAPQQAGSPAAGTADLGVRCARHSRRASTSIRAAVAGPRARMSAAPLGSMHALPTPVTAHFESFGSRGPSLSREAPGGVATLTAAPSQRTQQSRTGAPADSLQARHAIDRLNRLLEELECVVAGARPARSSPGDHGQVHSKRSPPAAASGRREVRPGGRRATAARRFLLSLAEEDRRLLQRFIGATTPSRVTGSRGGRPQTAVLDSRTQATHTCISGDYGPVANLDTPMRAHAAERAALCSGGAASPIGIAAPPSRHEAPRAAASRPPPVGASAWVDVGDAEGERRAAPLWWLRRPASDETATASSVATGVSGVGPWDSASYAVRDTPDSRAPSRLVSDALEDNNADASHLARRRVPPPPRHVGPTLTLPAGARPVALPREVPPTEPAGSAAGTLGSLLGAPGAHILVFHPTAAPLHAAVPSAPHGGGSPPRSFPVATLPLDANATKVHVAAPSPRFEPAVVPPGQPATGVAASAAARAVLKAGAGLDEPVARTPAGMGDSAAGGQDGWSSGSEASPRAHLASMRAALVRDTEARTPSRVHVQSVGVQAGWSGGLESARRMGGVVGRDAKGARERSSRDGGGRTGVSKPAPAVGADDEKGGGDRNSVGASSAGDGDEDEDIGESASSSAPMFHRKAAPPSSRSSTTGPSLDDDDASGSSGSETPVVPTQRQSLLQRRRAHLQSSLASQLQAVRAALQPSAAAVPVVPRAQFVGGVDPFHRSGMGSVAASSRAGGGLAATVGKGTSWALEQELRRAEAALSAGALTLRDVQARRELQRFR